MFYNQDLQKIRKVLYKYDIRLQQNLEQKGHSPENTEYEITLLDFKGMIDIKVKYIKFKDIKKIFELTTKNGLLDKNKFRELIQRNGKNEK